MSKSSPAACFSNNAFRRALISVLRSEFGVRTIEGAQRLKGKVEEDSNRDHCVSYKVGISAANKTHYLYWFAELTVCFARMINISEQHPTVQLRV